MGRKLRLITAGLTSCALMSSAACSSAQIEYEIPGVICNVKVDKKITSRILPPGKEIAERSGALKKSPSSCKVGVDKKLALFISVYQAQQYYDPMDPLQSHGFENRAQMQDLPFGWTGALGDNDSTIISKCSTDLPYVLTEVSVKVGDSDTSQRRKDIQNFATHFTKGAKTEFDCTE
ncbi:hypothetical protein [Streptomyces sp. NPDC093109]|uniref:hypothetical protein n=1 Tax=Streptomyces sp. NPDC093109 TaxID=3154977 RepID=UPI00344CEA0A